MRRPENIAAVATFRSLIVQRLGLQFDDAKRDFLAEIIQRRLDATSLSLDRYLDLLEKELLPDGELGALAKELTVPETYFFRNIEQFNALRDIVVPARIQARGAEGSLSALSAGCASGEEAYSIAMVLLDAVTDPAWKISVHAVDINPVVLKKARRGRYSAWAFREIASGHREKWFRTDGREFVISDKVRDLVAFRPGNLADDGMDLWRPGSFDVVFCRNVFMYFAPDQARRLISRISRALAPGGYFFVGHAETLRGLSDDFHLRQSHGTFYYQRKDAVEMSAPRPSRWDGWDAPAVPSVPSVPTDDWYAAIQRATDRVHSLSAGTRPDARPTHGRNDSALTPSIAPDMTPVFAMLHGERFGDALAYVHDLPREVGDDPGVLLVEALLLAHMRRIDEAERVCRSLLKADDRNAGAYYVLALCREAVSDFDGAVGNDRTAAYIDPTFAMPHLHTGLIARRLGDKELARREFTQALTLLKREDSVRLTLFAGGFNRQSLIELCASALKDCGGQS